MAFNLPPGCRVSDIPGNGPYDDICDVCFRSTEACICPECPKCETQGDPACYKTADQGGHGLHLSRDQLIGQTKAEIARLQELIAEHGMYLDFLEQQPEDWKQT